MMMREYLEDIKLTVACLHAHSPALLPIHWDG
jgi:hypothetical protein